MKRIISHPSYDRRNNWNSDIALLELEEPASYPTIRPVAANAVPEGKEATVIGWGTTSANSDIFPEKLLIRHQFPLFPMKHATKSYNQNP